VPPPARSRSRLFGPPRRAAGLHRSSRRRKFPNAGLGEMFS
jgi:hypothetical protein